MRLTRGERLTLWAVLAAYLVIYSYLTLFYRSRFEIPRMLLKPFRSYRQAFSFTNGFRIRRLGLARQILLNVLVYVPLGLMLPCLLRARKHPYWLTALLGLGLSVATEALQYFTRRGYCETDDLINNTCGCLLGLALFALTRLLIRRWKRNILNIP